MDDPYRIGEGGKGQLQQPRRGKLPPDPRLQHRRPGEGVGIPQKKDSAFPGQGIGSLDPVGGVVIPRQGHHGTSYNFV